MSDSDPKPRKEDVEKAQRLLARLDWAAEGQDDPAGGRTQRSRAKLVRTNGGRARQEGHGRHL